MSRFSTIAFMFICFNLSMGMFNFYNNELHTVTGHPLIAYSDEPQINNNNIIRLDNGSVINASNRDEYNQSIRDVLGFDPMEDSSGSFFDIYAFYSFVVKGIRILISILIMPLFGMGLMLNGFGFPMYIVIPIATMNLIIVIVGIVEFLSNRQGVFS